MKFNYVTRFDHFCLSDVDLVIGRGEKISVRSSNHLTHLIPSKEMTIEEAMPNFRAIGEVL